MAEPIHMPAVSDAPSQEAAIDAGSRKLVRPSMAQQGRPKLTGARRRASTLLTHQERTAPSHSRPDNHAEVFYFRKQMQAQTPMVFLLDDGERIEGVIEWFDLHVIKVRHKTRTMIYKSCIKYLYKAGEDHARESDSSADR